MKIRIAQLSEGHHSFDFVQTPAQLGVESNAIFSKQIDVHLELDRRRHIAVVGTVRTTGHFVCDRCLDEFDRIVEDDFRMVFTSDPDFALGEEGEELVFISPNTEELDFTMDARDALLLAVPMKLLCSESCRGLCPRCGANLNRETCTCSVHETDPRWQVLKGLFDSSSR